MTKEEILAKRVLVTEEGVKRNPTAWVTVQEALDAMEEYAASRDSRYIMSRVGHPKESKMKK